MEGLSRYSIMKTLKLIKCAIFTALFATTFQTMAAVGQPAPPAPPPPPTATPPGAEPPDPQVSGAPGGRPGGPGGPAGQGAPLGATTSISGIVDQYLLNPEGEADGLLLQSGTQIHFPPHLSEQLQSTVRPGIKVSINGFAEGASSFAATSITNITNQKSVSDAGPPPPGLRVPPTLRGVNLKKLKAQSTIKILLRGPRGETNGFVLADKTVVRMPPETAFALSSIFQVGQSMTVEGYGTESKAGKCLEATALGTANQPLISIYGQNLTSVESR